MGMKPFNAEQMDRLLGNIFLISTAWILFTAGFLPLEAKELLVEIPLQNRKALTQAVQLGLSLDDVSNSIARGIITEENLERLESAGFDVRILAHDVRDLLPSLKLPGRGEYHDYDELTTELQSLASTYPNICRLHDIGTSIQGRTIWALEITDNPDLDEMEPEVRLIGCHHGNEDISVEVPLDICHYLLENYGVIPAVTDLVNNREIWLIPMMNPDGLMAGTRSNAAGVDLNRDYGYMREFGDLSGAYSQPETKAIRNNALDHNFCFSLTYHSGAEYINYLWNYTPVRTPDDTYIVELSNAYDSFVDYGITEGYDWYQTKGDCNDWSYGAYGGMDWTIELSYDYEPPETQIDGILSDNRPAVLEFIDQALQGIGGVVTDETSGDPVDAMINIQQLDWPVFTQLPLGDFHRPLDTGTYMVVVSSPGYETSVTPGITVSEDQQTVVNVSLTPSTDDRNYARRVVSADSRNYNGNYPYPTHGHDTLGASDDEWFSLGKNGWIVLDLGAGTPVVDGPGNDISVYEGGTDGDEGFQLYGSEEYYGPWTLLGSGTGSSDFDLQGSGVSEARYVYVKDDDIGSSSVPNPGFDLDAIECGEPPNEPQLILTGTVIQDPAPGDNDGRLDPGEDVHLFTDVKNIWAGEATSIDGVLSTSDPNLIISSPSDSFQDIPGGSIVTNETGFGISALDTCPEGHVAQLQLSISASGGYSWELSLNLMVGQRELLFVDSDNENTETRLITALDAWGGSYTRLNVYSQETVPLDTLLSYRTIFWSAADQTVSSLPVANQTNMALYLDQGGSLLFTGENYLSAYGSTSFTSDYLHVDSYATSISGTVVNGVTGDPMGDGVSVTLSYPSGLAEYPDRVSPDAQAAEVFRMQGSSDPVAIRYPGNGAARAYRVIFFGAPLEAFPTSGTDPNNIQAVVARCLNWLGGGDVLAPSVPTGVELAADGTLSWTASTDNVGVDHYNIYRTTYPYFDIQGLLPFATTSSTSSGFPGSVGNPEVNYFFRITGEDATGNESSPSATVGEFDYDLPD